MADPWAVFHISIIHNEEEKIWAISVVLNTEIIRTEVYHSSEEALTMLTHVLKEYMTSG